MTEQLARERLKRASGATNDQVLGLSLGHHTDRMAESSTSRLASEVYPPEFFLPVDGQVSPEQIRVLNYFIQELRTASASVLTPLGLLGMREKKIKELMSHGKPADDPEVVAHSEGIIKGLHQIAEAVKYFEQMQAQLETIRPALDTTIVQIEQHKVGWLAAGEASAKYLKLAKSLPDNKAEYGRLETQVAAFRSVNTAVPPEISSKVTLLRRKIEEQHVEIQYLQQVVMARNPGGARSYQAEYLVKNFPAHLQEITTDFTKNRTRARQMLADAPQGSFLYAFKDLYKNQF